MDDDRIDFSPLDPSRDAARWERMIARVSANAMAPRIDSVGAWLVRWRGALLATSAVAMMAAWVPVLAFSEPEASHHETAKVSAQTVEEWANEGELPANAEVLAAISESANEQ